MATANPFDLLGEADEEDPLQLIAVQQKKVEPKKAVATSTKTAAQPKLPSKPLPPSQAVQEAKSEFSRGGRGGGRGYGRGRGSYRNSAPNENSYGNRELSGERGAIEETDTGKPSEKRGGYGGPRGPFRDDRRSGFSNGEDEQRRPFDRRSGTGRGNEIKREGSDRGNWGYQTDEVAQVPEEVVNEGEKSLNPEKPAWEVDAIDKDKEAATKEVEEKEPESEYKEMTLDEYEKVLEEKRKALETLKTEGRKVDVKQFESFQQLANKKTNDEIFVKLGSEKDKRKELAEKEEKAKKSVSINEFLKPSDGERYNNPGGRGRGRGHVSRGGHEISNVKAPSIEDPGQFPTLGGK